VFASATLMLRDLWYDLRHAFRALRRTPRNTLISLAILTLGIGANTAMFSAINHVLVRPLPFRDAQHLVRIRDQVVGADGRPHAFNMSSRNILALKSSAAVFDGLVAMSGDNMTLFGGEVPERVSVVLQTEGIDQTLGVTPFAGRNFSAAELRAGIASGVALISHSMWQSHFGGSSVILGSTVRLDARTFTVVGVMPPQYAFPYDAQFWVPHVLDPADQARDFAVWAHVRAGVTPAQVRAALDQAAAAIRREFPATLPTYGLDMMTMRENIVGTQDAPLRALTQIVGFLLFIACVNVATLLLARSVSRRREFAVRAALGASRGRHLRQLLAESLALAALGCPAGLLLAAWMAPLTALLVPSNLGGQLGLAMPRTDWRVAAFAMGVSLFSAAVAGIIPAFGSWRTNPRDALAGGRVAGTGRGGRRLLDLLIVAETTLTLVLLAGAGLVIRNFLKLQTLPLGFRASGLLALQVSPSPAAYPPGAARSVLASRIVEEVSATPGVEKAAITTVNPLGGGTWGAAVLTEEGEAVNPSAASNINHRLITPGLFEAMGIPVLQGRSFTDQDRAGGQPVAIVSDRMARRFWPNQDAIGRRVRIARPGTPWLTVVGVVGDVSDSHDPGVPFETWYLPLDQAAGTPAAERFYLMVRGSGDPLALVPAVQRAVARVDKTLAPYEPAAMDRYWDESISRERVSAAFMLAFGAFGLALAALGVYGVMAFSVAQRTTEFGIRLALGAGMADILPLALRRSLVLVAAGVAGGMVVAAALNRVLSTLLTEVGSVDATTLVGASLLILAAAMTACLAPAIGIARLDPVATLRAET
jgi:putative ABC transport system permease protein